MKMDLAARATATNQEPGQSELRDQQITSPETEFLPRELEESDGELLALLDRPLPDQGSQEAAVVEPATEFTIDEQVLEDFNSAYERLMADDSPSQGRSSVDPTQKHEIDPQVLEEFNASYDRLMDDGPASEKGISTSTIQIPEPTDEQLLNRFNKMYERDVGDSYRGVSVRELAERFREQYERRVQPDRTPAESDHGCRRQAFLR